MGRDVGLTIGASTVVFNGPSGFAVTYTKSGSVYTAPAGINADLVKNAIGTYTLTYHSSGEKLTFTSGGYLSSDADRNGLAITYLYNADGTLSSVTDTAGRVTTLAYTSGLIHTITDPAGRVTTYGYTGTNLTSVTDPMGNITSYGYDASNRIHQITTPRLSETVINYDSSNRVDQVLRYFTLGSTTSSAANTTFAYPSSTSTTETNPDNNTTTYTLDSTGRVTKVADPLGHTRSTSYTANSDVSTTTDAMGGGGNVTSYSYDSVNNLTAVATPTGAAATALYAGGTGCASTDTTHPYLPKCITNTQGGVTSMIYDTNGNLTSMQDTTGGTSGTMTSYARQGDGSTTCGAKTGQVCSVTDGDGHITSYSYDSDGNPTTITPPSPLGVEHLTWDTMGRLTSETDGKSQTTSYAYDKLDHLLIDTYPSSGTVTNTFDVDGNLDSAADTATGAGTTTYGYDALNRQTSLQQPNMSSAQIISLDAAGNTQSISDATGTTTYTLDTAGEVTAVAEPGQTCPAGTSTPTGCTRIGYDNDGNRTTLSFPGSTVQTTTYDASNRPTEIKAVNGSTVLTDLSYGYAATGTTGYNPTPGNTGKDSGVVTTRTDAVGIGDPAGSVLTYGYNSQSQLTSAAETSSGSTDASWAYTYDNAANRLSQTLTGSTGAPAGSTSYGYNTAGELNSVNSSYANIAFDADGNEQAAPGNPTLGVPIRGDGYTDRNQVASITAKPTGGNVLVPFTYTGTDNTTRLTAASANFSNGPAGINAVTTSGATVGYTRLPDGTLISQRTTGGSYYYLTDNLGSTVALVDSTGAELASYAYDPYGSPRYTGGASGGSLTYAYNNPYRYAAGYQDPTTMLYKLGARYYDTTLGRYTQPDPSGQEINTFAYSADNPTNNLDLSGLFSLKKLGVSLALSFAVATECAAFVVATGPVGGVVCGVAGAALEGVAGQYE